MWEMTEGYNGDPKLRTLFPVECPSVLMRKQPGSHLAVERLIGSSKLTRIVRPYLRRFTSQERLSHDIASVHGHDAW